MEALREAIRGDDRGRPLARGRVARKLTWERSAAKLIAILEEAHEARGLTF